jgi:hypothetical protein
VRFLLLGFVAAGFCLLLVFDCWMAGARVVDTVGCLEALGATAGFGADVRVFVEGSVGLSVMLALRPRRA